MLARTILIAAIAAAVYYLYKRWSNPPAPSSHPPSGAQAMRKCAHCGLHLPEKEAISINQLYFCSEDHQKRYLQEHP